MAENCNFFLPFFWILDMIKPWWLRNLLIPVIRCLFLCVRDDLAKHWRWICWKHSLKSPKRILPHILRIRKFGLAGKNITLNKVNKINIAFTSLASESCFDRDIKHKAISTHLPPIFTIWNERRKDQHLFCLEEDWSHFNTKIFLQKRIIAILF